MRLRRARIGLSRRAKLHERIVKLSLREVLLAFCDKRRASVSASSDQDGQAKQSKYGKCALGRNGHSFGQHRYELICPLSSAGAIALEWTVFVSHPGSS